MNNRTTNNGVLSMKLGRGRQGPEDNREGNLFVRVLEVYF